MATSKKTDQISVVIHPPDFRRVQLNIRGTSPLVMNRFSQKAMEIMKQTQEAGGTSRSRKTREVKDFDALYEGAKHVSDEGWEGIHAAAFRNAAISACRICGYKMTHAKLAFMVMADGYDRVDGAPLVRLTRGEAMPWTAPVRNQTGVADLRCRPLYREWEATLRIRYDAGALTDSDVVNLIARVGMQVGIGEGRPDSKDSAGIGFGLFDIV